MIKERITKKNYNLINNKTLKNNKAITLIALVITIVVLIILAGVAINLTLSSNGIFNKAKEGTQRYKQAEIAEKLELLKANLIIEKQYVSLDDYLELLQSEEGKKFDSVDIDRINDTTATIIIDDKYVYTVTQNESSVKMEYEGEAGKLLPRMVKVEVESTTTSISVKAQAKRQNEYIYYIKDNSQQNYVEDGKNATGEYTYNGLSQNTEYNIKVVAINENGEASEERTITTGIQLVTDISFDQPNITIGITESKNIIATVNPDNANNKDVIWTSENENVATVVDGRVTGVGFGKATITATATDGSGKSQSCEVTVKQRTIANLRTSGTAVGSKTEALDSNGNKIVIPEGFKIASDSGANVTEGIVIEDNDIKEGIGNNRGNQYVWIPVGTGIKKSDGTTQDITLGRYTFADGTNHKDTNGNVLKIGTPILKQNANSYTAETAINTKEQDSTAFFDYAFKELTTYRSGKASGGLDGENRTFRGKQLSAGSYEGIKSFIDSVNANGGYYIARYEASYGFYGTDTTAKAKSKVSNSFTNSSTAPTTRTEGMLWNHITQINAAKACENLYITVNSDLINSYAWDTAIVYIQKFSDDADYSRQNSLNKSLGNTGRTNNTKDEVCKINDMASNTFEWTTEYSTYTLSSYAYPFTHRGGYYNDTSCYTSYRSFNYATASYNYLAFRSTLYM